MKFINLIALCFCLCSCSTTIPIEDFSIQKSVTAPDYSNLKHWAAHPLKVDKADKFPKNFNQDTSLSAIDVFFIYPTLLLKGKEWNARIDDKKLNKKINNTAIKYQANVFNGLADIYSPIYRQMHIHGYRSQKNGVKALNLAYKDVEMAFKYYLKNYYNGNRIVIAAHSQGTNHAERLLKDFILKNNEIAKKVELAYLIGMPIEEFSDSFPKCNDPLDLHCFLTWRTFASGHYPNYIYGDNIAVNNPITWENDSLPSELILHKGILMQNNKIRFQNSVIAQAHQGLLWVGFENIPMSKLFEKANYHIADYNLFWSNIRSNFIERMTQ